MTIDLMTTDANWWERAAVLRDAASRLEGHAENLKNEAAMLRTTAAKCQQEAERVAALQELTEVAKWRDDALENAAQIVERYFVGGAVHCASDIRALKNTKTLPSNG